MEETTLPNLLNKNWEKAPAELRQILDKIKKIQVEKVEKINHAEFEHAAGLRDIEFKLWGKFHAKANELGVNYNEIIL